MAEMRVEIARLPDTIEAAWLDFLKSMEQANFVFDDEVRDTFRNLFYQGANFVLAHVSAPLTDEHGELNLTAAIRRVHVVKHLQEEMKAYEEVAMNAALANMMKDASAS